MLNTKLIANKNVKMYVIINKNKQLRKNVIENEFKLNFTIQK